MTEPPRGAGLRVAFTTNRNEDGSTIVLRRSLSAFVVVFMLTGCGSVQTVPPATPEVASGPGVTPQVFQSSPPSDWISFPNGPGSDLTMIAGPDEAMWFTTPSSVGRVTMDGSVTYYPISGYLFFMTLGPDNNFWFTLLNQKSVGRMTQNGAVSILPMPFLKHGGHEIATGPLQGLTRNLWVTADQADIFEISTQGRVIAKFSTPTRYSFPTAITTGPDGNLWFVEDGIKSQIGRMTTAGVFAEFPLPTNLDYGFSSGSIAAAKDGNLYTLEQQNSQTFEAKLVKISPAGIMSVIDIGDRNPTFAVATGPDGNPWFYTENLGLGYFNVNTQRIHHVGIPPQASIGPPSIGAGPDGNVWMPIGNLDQSFHMDVFVLRILTVEPSSVKLLVDHSQTVTVKETKYRGRWIASSSNENVATVTSGNTKDTFTISAVGKGSCTVTITDLAQNSTPVAVTVN